MDQVPRQIGQRAAAEPGRDTHWLSPRVFILFAGLCALSLEVVAQTAPVLAASKEQAACLAFVDVGENYKLAHENEQCLKAAEAGFGPAQYAVATGYGFAGHVALEEKYYRLAADQRIVSAYLGLGHLFADSKPWESIYWYQRFIAAKPEGYGYAALLVSKILERLGEKGQAAYWLEVCGASGYEACGGR